MQKERVYYDGTCPMCTVVADTISQSSQKEHFDLKDIHTEPALPYPKETHMKEIFAIGPDGVTHGADAVLAILSRYPRWRPIVFIGKLPGINQLLRVGYRIVASNRYLLSRFARSKRGVY